MMNLMVRSATGRYRQASSKVEVLEVAARYLAASLKERVFPPLTSPSAVEQFYCGRWRLATRRSSAPCSSTTATA
jgi:hypothetical protein